MSEGDMGESNGDPDRAEIVFNAFRSVAMPENLVLELREAMNADPTDEEIQEMCGENGMFGLHLRPQTYILLRAVLNRE